MGGQEETHKTSWFFTVMLDARAMPSTETTSPDNWPLRCSGPSKFTSVLSEFNIKKLQVIHVFMSLRHAWSLVSWLGSSGLIDRYNWVSSAQQWMFMECFLIILPKGSMYKVNTIDPSTEPYGTPWLTLVVIEASSFTNTNWDRSDE